MTSNTLIPSDAKLISQIDDCYIYKFDHRIRIEIANGSC